MPISSHRNNGNPNEAHPDDEDRQHLHITPPPTQYRTSNTSQFTASSYSSYQSNSMNVMNSAMQNMLLSSSSLASKPHAFSGAVLTPEHSRNMNGGLVLSLCSSLSLQAANAAQVRYVVVAVVVWP
jgi:hypothetical protein